MLLPGRTKMLTSKQLWCIPWNLFAAVLHVLKVLILHGLHRREFWGYYPPSRVAGHPTRDGG